MRFRITVILLPLFIISQFVLSDPLNAQGIQPDSTWTETESRVYSEIQKEGLKVVHFWATWCHNSRNEYNSGFWPEIIIENQDVEFVFVTMRNNGTDGADYLNQYDIPQRVLKLGQPWIGERRSEHNLIFMGLPAFWTLTTWIFGSDGQLLYAINYGESNKGLLQNLLEQGQKNWSQ